MFLKTNVFSSSVEKITPGQSNNLTLLSRKTSCIALVNPGVLETPTAFDFFKLKSYKESSKYLLITLLLPTLG